MPEIPAGDTHRFHVDLRGVVDLLSHHLYSSPRVYLRELLQNAVDAVTARQQREPDAPTRIRLAARAGTLRVDDPGIGLTEDDLHRFLSTIGQSSKRGDAALASARRDFLGQFGIGLLACFLVADEIVVVSRHATPGAATVEWRGSGDGSYTVRTLPEAKAEVGTTVTLVARPGCEEWLEPATVRVLARDFGSLLPYPVVVAADDTDVTVTEQAVWDRDYPSPAARLQAMLAYAEEHLGFVPLDVIELNLPVAGVRGVAFVRPAATAPGDQGRHRVYLRGMLLSDAARGLLPEWAFFTRCVITADALKPTASREDLYEDETLTAVRDALGERVRNWLTTLAAEEPGRLERFLGVHALSVKALARHDDELFRIMLPWLRFETTEGHLSLLEFSRKHQAVQLAQTVEEYRQVAAIAAAQGLGVVNGGYTYDAELVRRLPQAQPGVTVADLDPAVVLAHLDAVEPAAELRLAAFLQLARSRLDGLDCDVVLREFHPVSLPAVYLDSRESRQERSRAHTEAGADELWSSILGALRSAAPRAQLVLNHLSPVVQRIGVLADRELAATAVEALYGQALMMTHRPLRSVDTALINRTFGALVAWAANVEGTGQ